MMVWEPRFRFPFLELPRSLRTPMVSVRQLAGPKRRGESVTNRWGVIAGRKGLETVHVGACRRVAKLSPLEKKMPREFKLARGFQLATTNPVRAAANQLREDKVKPIPKCNGLAPSTRACWR